MAIRKLPSKRFQARLQDQDGVILTATFDSRGEAAEQVIRWKREKGEGKKLARSRKLTVSQFFEEWKITLPDTGSGWRRTQLKQFEDYISPVIGGMKLPEIQAHHVQRVLIRVQELGRGAHLQRQVYVLLRKMFGEAIENYRYLTFNPAMRKLRPAVPEKEAKHLSPEQAKKLLVHVDGKKYGLAIWIQLYLGLRLGELQALRWEDLSLDRGIAHVRRVWIKKTGRFRDYPKGRRQHSCQIPEELLTRLRRAKSESKGELVVPSPAGELVLPYKYYRPALKRYCREVGLPEIATHGLRHSTAGVYQAHGAQKDDLRELFAHSSMSVTERYIHGRGGNLEKVAKAMRLFESTTKTDHVTN